MQYTVPQFIDVEDKIIGPISVRQFLTFLVCAALIFANYEIVYKVFLPNFWVFAISSIFIFAVAGTFAFLKINGRPFHYFLLNFLVTMQKPRLRVWNKRLRRADLIRPEEVIEIIEAIPIKKPLTISKLTELSLIVDTGGAYQEASSDLSEKKEERSTKEENVRDIFSEP
ncbi:MAG: PrgI family protein [Candidatus Kerfeldbacteria bacterium]